MKIRLLKKINQRIRIVEKNDKFVVERKDYGSKEWVFVNDLSSFKRAVHIKNSYIVMILMRDMGYRYELVRRRTKRKMKKLCNG